MSITVSNSRVISLTANTELTVNFHKNLASITILNLGTANVYFRYDEQLAAVASDECMKLDSTLKGFDLSETNTIPSISFIADGNTKIQLLNLK